MQIRAGMYRVNERGRHEWLCDESGTPIGKAIGFREMLSEVFASAVAKRLNLKQCIELGEYCCLEVAEPQWESFEAELRTLSKHASELRSCLPTVTLETRFRYEKIGSVDNVLDNAIGVVTLAKKHANEGYVISFGG